MRKLFLCAFIFSLSSFSCENIIMRDGLQPLMDIRITGQINYYTVTFDSGNGSELITQNIEEGGKVSKPATPSRANHDFSGWFKEDACINEWDFNTDTVTKSITLYAGWKAITYIVTLDSMGGTSMNPISSVGHNTVITKPADPVRPGFGLDGWFKDEGLTDEWIFAEDTVTENITLYAKWTRNSLDVSLEMENITNINPVFDPIVISRSAAAPYFKTAVVYVDGTDYDEGSIRWEVPGVGAYTGETISGTGAEFTLDASDEKYNTPGGHILKLEVKQNGITYRVNIPFTIVN